MQNRRFTCPACGKRMLSHQDVMLTHLQAHRLTAMRPNVTFERMEDGATYEVTSDWEGNELSRKEVF